MIQERLTIEVSRGGDSFFWELFDACGRPLVDCIGRGYVNGYPTFDGAWEAGAEQARRQAIAARL